MSTASKQVQLSILYSRCSNDRALVNMIRKLAEGFNSLFEMLDLQKLDGYKEYVSFNSLFEMPAFGLWMGTAGISYRFNSLFEMRRSFGFGMLTQPRLGFNSLFEMREKVHNIAQDIIAV